MTSLRNLNKIKIIISSYKAVSLDKVQETVEILHNIKEMVDTGYISLEPVQLCIRTISKLGIMGRIHTFPAVFCAK